MIVRQKYICYSCGASQIQSWNSDRFYNKQPPETKDFPALLPCLRKSCSGTAYPVWNIDMEN